MSKFSFDSKYRFSDRQSWYDSDTDSAGKVVLYELTPPVADTIELPYKIRNRSIYIIGKPGNGKTTLLASIAQQDIENGAGIIVLDPKVSTDEPNLVDTLLDRIPIHRQKDVIYFTAQHPIPIDAMSWVTETDRQYIEGDIIKMFKTFLDQKTSDGESRWPNILRWTIKTILESKDCTFLDIYNFLAQRPTRTHPIPGERYRQIMAKVTSPYLKEYWEKFPEKYPADATTPIETKMSSFVLIKPISFLLGDPKPKFNMVDAIKERKIVLVDLTGAGPDTMNLLGILMVSRVQQAVSRGLRDANGCNIPCHLFVDEFQNFQTSAFDKMLSEYRSLQLRLTLANQLFDHLDSNIRSAITGTVQNFIVLNIDDKDTHHFKNKMPKNDPPVPHELLAQLPPYRALFAIHDQPSVIKAIPPPLGPPTKQQLEFAAEIRLSRMREYEDASCKSPQMTHTSENGKPDPQASPAVPPNDAGGASGTGGSLRTSDAGRGPNPQKKGPKSKRPEDYKPEL